MISNVGLYRHHSRYPQSLQSTCSVTFRPPLSKQHNHFSCSTGDPPDRLHTDLRHVSWPPVHQPLISHRSQRASKEPVVQDKTSFSTRRPKAPHRVVSTFIHRIGTKNQAFSTLSLLYSISVVVLCTGITTCISLTVLGPSRSHTETCTSPGARETYIPVVNHHNPTWQLCRASQHHKVL